MKKTDASNKLRSKAEKLLGDKVVSDHEHLDHELIHELQVHKIELELQNEELKSSQIKLEESRSKYWDLYDFAPIGYLTLSEDGIITEINLAGASLLKIPRNDLIKRPFILFLTEYSRKKFYKHLKQVLKSGEDQYCDLDLKTSDLEVVNAHIKTSHSNHGDTNGFRMAVIDISKTRQAEDLNESEKRLKLAQKRTDIGIWDWNVVTDNLQLTPEVEEFYGLNTGTIKTYHDWAYLIHTDDVERVEKLLNEKIINHDPFDIEFRIIHSSGDIRWLSLKGGAIYNDKDDIQQVLGVNTDITKRKERETKLYQLNRILIALRKSSYAMMHATDERQYLNDTCKIIMSEIGKSMIWIGFVDDENGKISPVTHTISLHEDNKTSAQPAAIIKDHLELSQTVIQTGKPFIHENNRDNKDNYKNENNTDHEFSTIIILPLTSYDKIFGVLNIYFEEIDSISYEELMLLQELADDLSYGVTSLRLHTAHEKSRKDLRKSLISLERSNVELEEFVHIIAHDLREPLRLIASFLQLLERRYQNKLDEDAKEFIGYAVGGAKRLDAMIKDVLIYSDVTSKEREYIEVDLNQVIEQVMLNLDSSIQETNSTVTYDRLPKIVIDEYLMVQLFQILIGNAIKYRRDISPHIHISCSKSDSSYNFNIEDNGIGISSDHLKKIFTIFKRLHNLDEYEGTGIGLAMAKKIVQQEGGIIWVESELGKGTVFHFTLPN